MRFFEYESRQIVRKAGIPVSAHGFARPRPTRAGSRRRSARPGDQVPGADRRADEGRRRQFADTPEEAGAHAEAILALEIGGHMPRGVLVDSRVAVAAGVLRRA